ncbi:hypothetical protein [Streptomyces sp. SCSIO ZS0520]|uniref:hypothetical protein n=1 Tax=Streptomyces sp. SCSIO ZS0520 TaxID=2892996 RepID=UPI0021D9A256|nr:hypothetical protein [Streptomyces sp. SCSIO ZS0520]
MSDRPVIPAASLRLLRELAEHDAVTFTPMPRARWRHPHTGTVFNDRTFHPLDKHALIHVGDGHTDPVRITPAGRAYLTAEAGEGR